MSGEIRKLSVHGEPVGPVKILDSQTKQVPVTPEIRVHEETITTDDKIRREAKQPGEPEVRVRSSEEGQQGFRKMLDNDD